MDCRVHLGLTPKAVALGALSFFLGCVKKIMSKPVRGVVLAWSLSSFGFPIQAVAAVQALFDLSTPSGGPFPSDQFTVPDPSHNTRRRVNLPRPDCTVRPSDCEDLAVINTLDGFNLQPRLSIPFDGPIDVTTVSSRTVFLLSLGSTVRGRDDDGCGEGDRDECDCDEGCRVIGINQVVWDTFTNTLHVQSDELLDQHNRYALIATRGVRDREGREVEASEAFRRFRQTVRGQYRNALLEAVQAARRIGIREGDMVTASVFTTQSATAILEKIRDQIKAATPEAADFRLGPGGTRTVFARDQVSSITFNKQTHVVGPLEPVRVAIELLDIIPGVQVGTLAFGKYLSPDYEVHPGEYIPPVGTRTGTPAVRSVNEIYFNLILPTGPKPAGGWPVAIFGVGSNSNKNDGMVWVSARMAERGIATIVINPVGMGYGPLSTLTVNQTVGGEVTFLEGGRGIDQDDDNEIGAQEGLFPPARSPRTIIEFHDGLRQTVADLIQLVRVIEVGMDVEGDGIRTLDPSRIYYFGISLGSFYGTQLLAVDPSVRAGVLNVPGGLWSPWRRISISNRASLGNRLLARNPPLLNPPGVTELGGVAVAAPYYNENQPLRNGIPLLVHLEDGTDQEIRSPVINTVAGAVAIQEMMDNRDLVGMSGDPVAYAPHLRKHPLAGVPAKSVIVQFAKGDQVIPNPIATALLRAGDLVDRATFYRHDLVFAEHPELPRNPHVFMISIEDPMWPGFTAIALAAQDQIAVFFATDGEMIIHPEPARFFEVPIQGPLPEDLNFIIP
jgi:hypothetical protein